MIQVSGWWFNRGTEVFDHSSVYWMLNAPLTEEGVLGQVRSFRDMGFTSVLPAPIANGTARKQGTAFANSGMRCDYLSDEFFRQYAFIVHACRECGLKIWVWDDDFCPAGWAGGAIVKKRPDLRGKLLQRIARDAPMPENTQEVLAERDGRKYVFTHERAVSTRVDVFHADAGKLFIELNYEKCREHFEKDFGKVIAGMFTDEPGIPGFLGGLLRVRDGAVDVPLPWTDDVAARWKERHGTDLTELLPMLFMDADDSAEARKVRAHFGALMHELWVTRWMDPCREWCEKHGLNYSGHMNNDDYVEAHMGSAGDLLDNLSHFDLPGVDTVVCHILPDKERQPDEGRSEWDVNFMNGDFARFASSAARSTTANRASCELADCYGWGAGPELRKWLLDYHIARGIDFIHWGSIQYSVRGRDVMCTAGHFGDGQPFWPLFKELNRYQRRILELLCTGERCAEAAVFYPAQGYMSAKGHELNEKFEALGAFLRWHGVDFDYVGMRTRDNIPYQQIFVPVGTPLTDDERRWLAREARTCEVVAPKGLSIVGASGYQPREAGYERGLFHSYACGMYGDLQSLLRPVLNLSGASQLSFHRRTLAPDEHLIFAFNEGTGAADEPAAMTLLAGERFLYDWERDAFFPTADAAIRLEPGESCLVFVGKRASIERHLGKVLAAPVAHKPERIELPFHQGCFSRATRHHWDGESIQRTELSELEYRQHGTDFSGVIERRFEMMVNDPSDGIELVVPNLVGAAAVKVGHRDAMPVGTILWPPKRLFISPEVLTPGSNVIWVAVHNTLANHVRSNEFKETLREIGASGNVYFQITEAPDRRAIERARPLLNPW